VEDIRLSSVRVNWQLKAILPVGLVLLSGLLLFILATVSLRDPERHAVLIVAGAGAVAICAVLIVVLAYVIQRPGRAGRRFLDRFTNSQCPRGPDASSG
jgi:hypothetical protein